MVDNSIDQDHGNSIDQDHGNSIDQDHVNSIDQDHGNSKDQDHGNSLVQDQGYSLTPIMIVLTGQELWMVAATYGFVSAFGQNIALIPTLTTGMKWFPRNKVRLS